MADPRSIVWIDKYGTALAVYDGVTIPAGVPGSLLMGSDGVAARRIVVDAVGRVVSVGLGVAGVPDGGVMSVQGVVGGLPLPVSVTGTVTLGSSSVTADQGAPALVALAWPTKVSDGVDTVGISTVGLQKALKVDVIQTVGGGGGTSSLFGVAFPLSGTAGGFSDGVSMQGARVYDTDTGVGSEYTLGANLRFSAGGGSVEAGTNANPIQVGDAGGSLTVDQGAAAGAAAPWSARLSDGAAFYTAPNSGQLPAALVGGRLTVNVGAWFGSTLPFNGQKVMASSIPVVIASDQTIVPITSGQLPAALGRASAGNSLSVTLSTDDDFVAIPGAAVPGNAAYIAGFSAGSVLSVPTLYDMNTGAGIDFVFGVSLRKSTAAGSVELGTATDPIRTDPTGTTAQPVTDAGGSLTVDTTQLPPALVGGRLLVDGSGVTQPVSGTVAVTDGGGSLTVDSAQLPATLGQKTGAASLSVTLSSDDDFIGDVGVSVPGKGAFIGGRDPAGNTLVAPNLFDMNTGAGIDWVFGVSLRKSTAAGSVELGTAADPMRVDPTGTTTQPVSSTQLPAALVGGRLDENVGAWLGSTAPSVGQKAMASSLPITIASDQAYGVVSAANSSTATLAGAATFTGTGESTLAFGILTVTVMAIGATAPPGTLRVEQSSDNANWDIRDDFAVDGGTASPTGSFDISVGLVAEFYRVSYINGATAQTAFRLETIKWSNRTPLPNAATRKGVQSQTFLAAQEAKDTGRSRVVISFEAVAPATADTLLTLVKKTNGVAAAGATTIPVAAGKTLRIVCVTFSIKANAAAAAFGTLTLRENPAGAVVIGSPTWGRIDIGNTANTVGAADKIVVPYPDGVEFSGANQIGASLAAQAVTNIISIEMIGFEY